MFKILFVFLFFSNVFASDVSTFIVSNIPVSVESSSAQDAKKIALLDGQRKALKLFFKNSKIDPDYTRFIDDSTISEMVESVKVNDEIITKKSYSSKITIIFNKKFLDFNLKKLNIEPNKVTNSFYLYIPVFDSGNDNIPILDSKNLWYSLSYKYFFENEDKFPNIVMIDNYDLSNTAIFSSNREINYSSLKTLMMKYNSNSVLIAKAKKEVDGSIFVDLKEIDAEDVKDKTLSFSNIENLSNDSFFLEASKRTLEFFNNSIKERVINSKNSISNIVKSEKYIDVLYTVNSISDYSYIISLIDNLDFIKNYETLKFTTKIVGLRLHYNCDESELIPLLNNKGLNIVSKFKKNFLEYRGF